MRVSIIIFYVTLHMKNRTTSKGRTSIFQGGSRGGGLEDSEKKIVDNIKC